MKYKEWKLPERPMEIPEALTGDGFSPLLAAMLVSRGFVEPEAARKFIHGGYGELHDPMLLADMESAVHRVQLAIERRETVAVFGDYDVDGITSACLVTSWLREKGLVCHIYIPDRIDEGYGLNHAAMDTLKAQAVTLIITVDCGITAREEALYADSLGIDMVITDHHECGMGKLPQAIAVVDPKRPDCPYPDDGLAGVGVAFKLLCAVEGDSNAVLEEYADLIAIGTVADIMPLVGENRYIVQCGVEKLSKSPRPGIRALILEAGAQNRRISAGVVGFTIAPRINAAGRLGNADIAVRLLLTKDELEAANLAAELCGLNRERQELEQVIWQEACAMMAAVSPNAPIVLAAEGWHQGVVGIVASKLSEQYSLPTIMICLDGDVGKGSCRSFGDFNLFDALAACSEWLDGFGGHALAAGLSIRRENVEAFRQALEEYYSQLPHLAYNALCCDMRIDDPSMLSMKCVESLELLEPFGSGNPRPTLCITDVLLERIMPMGGGKHLRLTLSKGGAAFSCVLFSCREEELGAKVGDRIDAAFYPQINEYRGQRSIQLLIVDVRQADTLPLCRQILDGKQPLNWEAADLCPLRSDFVQVWRWLERRGGIAGGEVSSILGWRPGGMHPAKLLVCLHVMSDKKLISVQRDKVQIRVEAIRTASKADLENHPLVIRLRGIRQNINDWR